MDASPLRQLVLHRLGAGDGRRMRGPAAVSAVAAGRHPAHRPPLHRRLGWALARLTQPDEQHPSVQLRDPWGGRPTPGPGRVEPFQTSSNGPCESMDVTIDLFCDDPALRDRRSEGAAKGEHCTQKKGYTLVERRRAGACAGFWWLLGSFHCMLSWQRRRFGKARALHLSAVAQPAPAQGVERCEK